MWDYDTWFRIVQLVAVLIVFVGLSRNMKKRIPALTDIGLPQYLHYYGGVVLWTFATVGRLETHFDIDFWSHLFAAYWIIGIWTTWRPGNERQLGARGSQPES